MKKTASKITKVLCLCFLAIFVFCSCGNNQKTPEQKNETNLTEEIKKPLVINRTAPKGFSEICDTAGFYCIEDREALFLSNESKKISPASLTKLLTAGTAYYYTKDSEKKFTVGTELSLVEKHASLCLISKGQVLTLKDLTTGLLMASGNDAAYTIAVNVARNMNPDKALSDKAAVEYFLTLMNNFALQIGMKNTNFTNPDGMDDINHYTTVGDLLILAQYALTVPDIREIVAEKEKHVIFASGENITWKNSNLLLDSKSDFFNKYASGMKTGTTPNAGNCLIASFNKNGKTYIGIVCGCKTGDGRYKAMNILSDNFS